MKYRLLALTLLFFCLPVAVTAQRYARVISENANLRETPSVTSVRTVEVSEDTIVKVLDEKLPWYVVRVGNRVGWMHGNTLEFVATSGAAASERVTEQTITPNNEPSTTTRPRREASTTSPPTGVDVPASPSGDYTPRRVTSNPGYIRGPRGGCYYISASGRKVYVDRSLCN